MKIKQLFRRGTIRDDAVSGVVLGVESVPDSLASGLLAGVNPIFGLYGAMWGTFTGPGVASQPDRPGPCLGVHRAGPARRGVGELPTARRRARRRIT